MKKYIYREDLNRHISQKVSELASLAFAGRYPQFIFRNQTCELILKAEFHLSQLLLHHIAMVAEFLDNSKQKISLKK